VSTTSDLSLNKGSINGTRYFEITTFLVKAGHRHDFEQLTHMYADVYRKVAPDGHWDCFEVMYRNPVPGVPSGRAFIVVNTMKSQAETDKGIVDSEKFAKEHRVEWHAEDRGAFGCQLRTRRLLLASLHFELA
jgi:hypothetical protein